VLMAWPKVAGSVCWYSLMACCKSITCKPWNSVEGWIRADGVGRGAWLARPLRA
jgi:hypothetical protein